MEMPKSIWIKVEEGHHQRYISVYDVPATEHTEYIPASLLSDAEKERDEWKQSALDVATTLGGLKDVGEQLEVLQEELAWEMNARMDAEGMRQMHFESYIAACKRAGLLHEQKNALSATVAEFETGLRARIDEVNRLMVSLAAANERAEKAEADVRDLRAGPIHDSLSRGRTRTR